MLKLKKKSIIPYQGKVYDLSVSTEDKSYNIDNVVVHNSAGGCLILFILDITKIDPVRHNLIFERFLNPGRQDPPDVDIDLDSKIHKQVEDYLKDKYGREKVCHIANFNKFGAKSVVKDLCRVFELDYYLSNKLTGLFSKFDRTVSEELIAAKDLAIKMQDEKLLNFIDENFDNLSKYGDRMIGMVRQVGRHASGILISNNDLNVSDIPINRLKGELITGVQEGTEDREVSELGYLKLDILGLTNASVINETIKLVEQKYGIKDLENTLIKSDFDHQPVWDEFAKGNCQDIFQFGGDGMIDVIKDIKPKNIYELCAINALYRPANIEAGMIKEYKDNRNNPEAAKAKLSKIDPDLWEILKETFGAIAYQEQTMFILQKIGGFTLAEADSLRKTLKTFYRVGSEQHTNEKFIEIIKRFEDGALKKGVSKENAHDLLQTLSKYTGYTFNKCLSLNTNVITPNGIKNIKKIKVGEEVLSYDYKKNDVYTTKVKNIHKNGKKKLYRIKTDTGHIIESTLDHKFMVANGTQQTLQTILDKNLEIIDV